MPDFMKLLSGGIKKGEGSLISQIKSMADYSGSPEPVNPLFRATCSDWQSRSE